METLLVMNRIMGRYKSILKNDEMDLTFNEALALEAIKGNKNTKGHIREILLKDKSYISRLINNLYSRGMLEKEGHKYTLTSKGERVHRETSEIYNFIREDYSREVSGEEIQSVIESLEKIENSLKNY